MIVLNTILAETIFQSPGKLINLALCFMQCTVVITVMLFVLLCLEALVPGGESIVRIEVILLTGSSSEVQ